MARRTQRKVQDVWEHSRRKIPLEDLWAVIFKKKKKIPRERERVGGENPSEGIDFLCLFLSAYEQPKWKHLLLRDVKTNLMGGQKGLRCRMVGRVGVL